MTDMEISLLIEFAKATRYTLIVILTLAATFNDKIIDSIHSSFISRVWLSTLAKTRWNMHKI